MNLDNIRHLFNDMWRLFNDIWYVWILKKHKHSYKRIEDGHIEMKNNGTASAFVWQRHQCEKCKKIIGLEDWQIENLPKSMLYEKLPVKIDIKI